MPSFTAVPVAATELGALSPLFTRTTVPSLPLGPICSPVIFRITIRFPFESGGDANFSCTSFFAAGESSILAAAPDLGVARCLSCFVKVVIWVSSFF